MISVNRLTPEERERLERIVVELLGIVRSSNDSEIQLKLRRAVDQLVELLEQ